MKKRIYIAQMLLAEVEISSVRHIEDTEDGYIYSVKPKNQKSKRIRVKPGGTIQIKKGDEFETIDLNLPHDITVLQESNMKDFHTSLMGWLRDSRRIREEV